MVSLKLFGGASIEGPDGPLTGRASQRHRLALLALLAATPRGLTRDKLIAYLWPERDPERARHALSDSIYRINRALGEEAVLAAGDELRLDAERVPSDVAAFRDALERRQWERATDAYSGPLLDGFHLPATAEFGRWLDGERERLSRQYAMALESLAEERAADGDVTGAVAAWHRRAAQDRYDSRVAVRLMEALDAAGNRAGALRHARIHAQLLEGEFGTGPDPEVLALAERLRKEPGAGEEAAAPPKEGAGPAVRTGGPAGAVPVASAPGAEDPQTRAAGGVATPRPSIAVLPFINMSPDADNEYFSDGLSEELINVLAHIPRLKVAARTSSFAFRGENLDARELAQRLGVAYLLEGSVRKEGDRLRISVQLVETGQGYQVWTYAYDRGLEDIFAVQEEIARAIAGALRVRLGVESADLAWRGTSTVEAYLLYLEGRFHLNKRNRSAYRRAVECFERAIEADPEYALAYSGLADLYLLFERYTILPPDEAIPRAREAAERAVELAPDLAETRTSLAYVRMQGGWDPASAEQEFRRAIRNDPECAAAHHWYGWHLLQRGRLDEGLAEFRRALELEPLSLIVNTNVGSALYMMRHFDEAVDACRRALELESRFAVAHQWLGRSLEMAGRPEEGAAAHRRALEILGGDDPESIASLGHARGLAGDRGGAERALSQLETLSERQFVSRYWPGLVHLGIRQFDRALDELARAFDERFDWCLFVGVDPMFEPLRGRPRFEELLHSQRGRARWTREELHERG